MTSSGVDTAHLISRELNYTLSQGYDSIMHFDLEVEEAVGDFPGYTLIGNYSYNLTEDHAIILTGGAQLNKATLLTETDVTIRINASGETIFDEVVRSLRTVKDRGVFTLKPLNFTGTSGTNTITIEITEDGNGQINLSSFELHFNVNETKNEDGIEYTVENI